jgi:hypothetical protein
MDTKDVSLFSVTFASAYCFQYWKSPDDQNCYSLYTIPGVPSENPLNSTSGEGASGLWLATVSSEETEGVV